MTAPKTPPNPGKAKRLRVEFEDGRVETLLPNRPALLIAFEREHNGRDPQSVEDVCWLIWHVHGRPEGVEFDEFVETIASIDTAEPAGEPGKARPSR